MEDPTADFERGGVLLTGTFHPVLEDALLAHLARVVADAPLSPVTVAVPTNLLGLRLSRLLAAGTGGHVNVRFLTLKDLSLSVAGTPLPDGRALLPPRADEVALRKLLDGGLAEGGYFERIADRPGLAGALLAAIGDLKEAGYTPESLAKTAGGAGLLRRGRDCKLTELVRIWRAYETELASDGWADTLDAMAAAVRVLESTATAGRRLIVYGFYDLNSLQRRLVAAHGAGNITVYFPFADLSSFDYARPTLRWFESLGLRRVDLPGVDAREVPLPAGVKIISAPGEGREAREDVRELARVLDEGRAPFQSAAVLTRSPDPYFEAFREELDCLGARPYLEAPPPLSRSRSGRSLIKLGEAVRADFARVELMEFLSLADLEPENGAGRPPVADWNKAAVLAGITSGAASWEERLTGLLRRLEQPGATSRLSEAHGHLKGAVSSLLPLVARIVAPLSKAPARATVGTYLNILTDVFEDVTRPSRERRTVLEAAGEVRALSDVAGEVTLPRFLELLATRLGEPGAREERFGTGGPTVLNLMAARGLSFPIVVVPGLVEKKFPATHRQDPVLLDAERELLNRARGDDPLGTLPIRSANVDEERLLFHLAVSSAEETLILSFPRLDPASARPRVPSPLVLRALEELTGERHDYERLEVSPRVTRVPLSRRFPQERKRALTREEFDGCSVIAAMASGDPSEIAYLVHEDGPLPRRLRMEEVRWGTPAFTEYDGAVTSPDAVEAAAALCGFKHAAEGELAVAPTTLEEYARCPFAFFMSHVLGVEPLEEPEETLLLSPLERGSLYHEVLERFMRTAASSELLPLTADARETLFDVAARVVRSGRWSVSGTAGAEELALRNLVRDLSLWLVEEVLENSPYVPSYFEARFGGRPRPGDDENLSSEEGVPFEAAGGVRVRFSGRIDRIDLTADETRARVIDYKTGRPQPRAKKLLDAGRRLQLPVYLMAAARLLDEARPGATVDSAQYLYLGRGGTARTVLTRGEVEDAMDDLRKAVALIVRGIESGMFFHPPGDPGCSYCDFADACGPAAAVLSKMKSGDPRVEFFTEMLSEIT